MFPEYNLSAIMRNGFVYADEILLFFGRKRKTSLSSD